VIDLHNHILPGLDDGAADLTESVEIARQFVREGVAQIAATPHLDPSHDRGASPDEIDRRLDSVRDALAAEQVPLGVARGQEVFLTPEIVSLLEGGSAITLAESQYVLVEVSLVSLARPFYLDETLFRLQLGGFRPILAHPERYPFVQRDPQSAGELASRGVVLQVTAPSLLGEYGSRVRRTAERLVREGHYQLAGSDRHHPGPRRSLAELHDRLSADLSPEAADVLLRENPRRVLNDQPLLALEPAPPRVGFSWHRLFRR
jgi:protein-tyrosine phosphatase